MFEPEPLKKAMDQTDIPSLDRQPLQYKMDFGLTMPVLYLDYINVEKDYQRQGHGTRALKTIIEAFDNSSEFPENVHILLQCKRNESYCVGSPESEYKKFFKRFGFESIDAWPMDRHFMTVPLEERKFPRLPKTKKVY